MSGSSQSIFGWESRETQASSRRPHLWIKECSSIGAISSRKGIVADVRFHRINCKDSLRVPSSHIVERKLHAPLQFKYISMSALDQTDRQLRATTLRVHQPPTSFRGVMGLGQQTRMIIRSRDAQLAIGCSTFVIIMDLIATDNLAPAMQGSMNSATKRDAK